MLNIRPHPWPTWPVSPFENNARWFLCILGQTLGPTRPPCLSTKEGFLQSHFLYWKCSSTELVRQQRQLFSSLAKGWLDRFGRTAVWHNVRAQGRAACADTVAPIAFLGWTWEPMWSYHPEASWSILKAGLSLVEPACTKGVLSNCRRVFESTELD